VLKSLHARGIIHRDIKPENIFFEQDGKLVLGDFGLAVDSSRDKPVSRVGTQEYMAPEVRGILNSTRVTRLRAPCSKSCRLGGSRVGRSTWRRR
jgi:serine/threonine protein kinase